MRALNQSNCEHAYENTWVNETYLQNGYTLHKCKKCGKTYKDEYIKKKTLNQNYFGVLVVWLQARKR